MTKNQEKLAGFTSTVQELYRLALRHIPDLGQLREDMPKYQPKGLAAVRQYRAALRYIAEEQLDRERTGKGPAPASAPASSSSATSPKREVWGNTNRIVREQLRSLHLSHLEDPYTVLPVVHDSVQYVTVHTGDRAVDFGGVTYECVTQLLYVKSVETVTQLVPERLSKVSVQEVEVALPKEGNGALMDESYRPLFGGGPVNMPNAAKDRYDDNQWVFQAPVEGEPPLLFRLAVHGLKNDQDHLDWSRFYVMRAGQNLSQVSRVQYLQICSEMGMVEELLTDVRNKLYGIRTRDSKR